MPARGERPAVQGETDEDEQRRQRHRQRHREHELHRRPEIGLDLPATQRAIHRESGEPGLAPAPLLEQMVTAGRTFRR